jgi:hypothetical protein
MITDIYLVLLLLNKLWGLYKHGDWLIHSSYNTSSIFLIFKDRMLIKNLS